jgi:hypothetical protein
MTLWFSCGVEDRGYLDERRSGEREALAGGNRAGRMPA